jgi:hypothetical protein
MAELYYYCALHVQYGVYYHCVVPLQRPRPDEEVGKVFEVLYLLMWEELVLWGTTCVLLPDFSSIWPLRLLGGHVTPAESGHGRTLQKPCR